MENSLSDFLYGHIRKECSVQQGQNTLPQFPHRNAHRQKRDPGAAKSRPVLCCRYLPLLLLLRLKRPQHPYKPSEVAAEAWTTVTKNGKNVYHKTGAKIGYNHTCNDPDNHKSKSPTICTPTQFQSRNAKFFLL